MAVKLYEKDPSKLTATDEVRPSVNTGSDISDEEDSNLESPEVKDEPFDASGQLPLPGTVSFPVQGTVPGTVSLARIDLAGDQSGGYQKIAGKRDSFREPITSTRAVDRNSYSSSSHEDPSTDSENVRRKELLLAHFYTIC